MAGQRPQSDEVLTDPLTAVPNRRWLDIELGREIARATRQGFPLSVAILDLDHFKVFNGRYGHRAGDALLRTACELWREVLRASDFLARYGGEEFVVLLPDCTLGDALAVMERLRMATPAGETCSAGLVMWAQTEPPEELIARADAALCAAKAAGRDCVVSHGHETAGI